VKQLHPENPRLQQLSDEDRLVVSAGDRVRWIACRVLTAPAVSCEHYRQASHQ